ncbi:hypothetical protein [Tychonema sp. LEGE 07203]|uniref:hypothetical protein n=1 Tax=Tychonema sp. LEGE 07203 TaxID=1828671 RepID=UPI00187F4A25|nr:hypothetical protein [Tychonema sp. LEGE 07203]MBE9095656.1 hypothetical protein [Tychonema sp. LEGE 07203]
MLRLLRKYSVGCIYLSEKLRPKPVFLLLLAIAQNRYFLAGTPVRGRDEKNLCFSAATDAIAQNKYLLDRPPVNFETKNNLKGEHLRYDRYYYYRTRSFKL